MLDKRHVQSHRQIWITSSTILGSCAKGTYLAEWAVMGGMSQAVLVKQKDDVLGIYKNPHLEVEENRSFA